MIEFESINVAGIGNEDKKLSLILKDKINFLYHNEASFLQYFINLFNGKSLINHGSIIIDEILINELEVKDQNNFFYNYVSYNFDLSVFSNHWSVEKLIKNIELLYPHHLNTKIINDLLQKTDLLIINKKQLKDLNELDKIKLSIFLSLIKNPKLVLCKFNDEIFNLYKKEIVAFLNIIQKSELSCNIIFLTSSLFYYKEFTKQFYDLTNHSYYLDNNNLTIYTNPNFYNYNKRNLKLRYHNFLFIFKSIFLKKIYQILFFILLSTFFNLISLFFSSNTSIINYIMIYTCVSIACLSYFMLIIHYAFFKRNEFLLNFNILGFNNIFIILSIIMWSLLIAIVPSIIAFILFFIIYFNTSITPEFDLLQILYPFITYLSISIIISFIFSIKLRININNVNRK